MRADRARSGHLDLSGRTPVGLDEVVQEAARLTRVDRKYLVDRATAESLLARLPETFRLLTIDRRQVTSYSSVYFDTPELGACRDHVQGRRRRWKVRSRLYVEDQLCRFEVKTRNGRGVTDKTFAVSHPGLHGRLGGEEATFVTGALRDKGLDIDVASLAASMRVDYQRVTLADTGAALRVTLDWGVECSLGADRVWFDEGWVLVETKGGRRPSAADAALASLGVRPRSFSKYVSAASLLRDDIPDNDVRRLRGRQLHTHRAAA